jgi:uncharacterized protein YcbK (DUF882 family)
MIDSLRPFLSRVLAPVITAFVMWLLHLGIDLGPDASAHLTEYATVIAIALFSVLNGVIHRLIDKKVNPGDTASSHLAVEAKEAATEAKERR